MPPTPRSRPGGPAKSLHPGVSAPWNTDLHGCARRVHVHQDGSDFDGSSTLRRLAEQVGAAAPAGRWTGPSADAYAAVNAEQGRVLTALADLDRRLREQVDESARLVRGGRESLDATRRWVVDAAASVPPTAAGQRMLVPVVARGLTEVIDTVSRSNSDLNAVGARIAALGEEYRALGVQRFGGGDKPGLPAPQNSYETALRAAGLLHETPSGYYREWLENAELRVARRRSAARFDADQLAEAG